MRLDFTCVGWKGGTTKRRNMSVLFQDREQCSDPRFKDCDVLLLNRSKMTVVNLLEELDEDEKIAVLHDLMNSNPVRGDFKILEHKVSPAKTFTGRLKKKKIDDWLC